MNRFLELFTERGYLHQCTDLEGLRKLSPPVTAYIGFDLTAPSLHVGSLMQIMILRLLQKTGNKPIILLGSATTKIGDPSGKDEARKILSDAEIEKNKSGIKKTISKFLDVKNAVFVDNDEWLKDFNYMNFLRDYGRFFSVNKMLGFESVKMRLERQQNLSFLEFNYMILQACDFIELNKHYGCRLQIGGSDQWGNIVSGVELNRRVHAKGIGEAAIGKFEVGLGERREEKELFGLTTPLITTAGGAKMGKTTGGAVWLDEELLPAYDYYQFWRNTDDGDVIRFLNFFTELAKAEIDKLAKLKGQEINEAKKILAFEATRLCHGEKAAEKAADAARTAFEEGGTQGLPEVKVEKRGYKAFELLVAAGLAASNGEAKRLIQGGGAKINDRKIENENEELKITDGAKLSAGKKKHVLISF